MTERPILFSAPMVRALLAGTKTQTRRVVKTIELRGGIKGVRVESGAFCYLDYEIPGLGWCPYGGSPVVPYPQERVEAASPYGKPDDRLWVKETWRTERAFNAVAPVKVPKGSSIQHAEEEPEPNRGIYGKTRPSIFMMRWMSRITLEVTAVRVERLNTISETDAKAEGAAWRISPGGDLAGAFDTDDTPIGYRAHFQDLWESINGAESWAVNPWVWVVEFKRVTP